MKQPAGRKANLIVTCSSCKGYRYALSKACHRCGDLTPIVPEVEPERIPKPIKPAVPMLNDRNASFVYLISDGTFSKIGFAKNLTTRLSSLQNASPYELQVVDAIETTEPRALEAFLHGLFARKHHRNEWFTHISIDEWRSKVVRAQELLAEQEQHRLRLIAVA